MTVIGRESLDFIDLPGRRSANPLVSVLSEASVRVVELERTSDRTAHRHPFSEEIIYVAAGHGKIWIDGETQPVTAGDVVHVPTGAAHATVPEEGEHMQLICFFPHPHLSDNIEDTDTRVN